MNKISVLVLLFTAVALFTFTAHYNWMDVNIVTPKTDLFTNDHHTEKIQRAFDKTQCDTEIKSKLYQTSREYCQSPCATNTLKNIKKYNNLVYNDKYKFIFCLLPKVGSSNWRRIMLVLSDKVNTSDPLSLSIKSVYAKYLGSLPYLASLPQEEISYRLKHYYKFIFVRDPLERLLSTYQNKFCGKNRFAWRKVGTRIIRAYRSEPTEAAVASGLGVRFSEFVAYVVDSSVYSYDIHWQLISILSSPCEIKYDFVGHLNNSGADAKKVLDHLGLSHLVQYPERDYNYKYANTTSKLKEYYNKIPLSHLVKLVPIYNLDYLMFNLTIPPILQNMLNK
ncbi:carbohydrate sulfotransferase 11-like isoform X1 [Gigantopelta aegis]|uniref:carbohydrate sulfotransferase 11-like isoform X1 n=1 Tax=Gigantopelta aegis TaxID=1735272 RepID=UPI001B88D76B|nr:carbohydrate sulfotransferase 11-like isoform X1 [Gigantopelta aegis]